MLALFQKNDFINSLGKQKLHKGLHLNRRFRWHRIKFYKKLYDDGKKKYELAFALYNNAKAAAEQANSFLITLNNPQYTPKQALELAASYAPNICLACS